MSPSDSEVRRKSSGARKLLKRRKITRRPSMAIPDRFKDGDDAHEDVTAPKGTEKLYLNQSVFSMLAAAGSKTDFNSRFEDDSESEPDNERPSPESPAATTEGSELSSDVDQPQTRKSAKRSSRLLKSLPRLSMRGTGGKGVKSRTADASPSASGRASTSSQRATSLDAERTGQMPESAARTKSSLRRPEALETPEEGHDEENEGAHADALAVRLKDIFEFDKSERVISEYPCWLLKSVLLQGYMYITAKHICFYAYLPKKSNVVIKSGYLTKRGRQNPKYNRYWFALKGDVLSYYADPSNLYFPSGNIDLRYGLSATIAEAKEKGKEESHFSLSTDQRVYYFKADSPASAREWVKTLQKVIFRSHNDGDSVKVSLPIENVIDIEDSPVIEFAETFKIRVIDNDETYAIDEYFFSFFSFGREALDTIRILVDDTPAQRVPDELLKSSPGQDAFNSSRNSMAEARLTPQEYLSQSPTGISTPVLRDSVKATLAPISSRSASRGTSPRASCDFSRASFDGGRRSTTDYGSRRSLDVKRELAQSSFSRGRSPRSSSRKSFGFERRGEKSPFPKHEGSSDSYVNSMDQTPLSPDLVPLSPGEDNPASASQILNRSDVFQSPTIVQREASGPGSRPIIDYDSLRRHSEESSRFQQPRADIRIRPPTRSHTAQDSLDVRPAHGADNTSESDGGMPSRPSHSGPSNSAPTLQELVKAGSYPLQRAAGFAGFLKNRSKRMSSLLATESMGYMEKVSGMWTGARRHYDEPAGLLPDDQIGDLENEDDALTHGDRFRAHFALPEAEKLQATFFGYLHRVLPLYGKIYIGTRSFCFRSLLPGTRTKLVLPLKVIENVDKEKGFRFGYSGLVVVIRGHEELFFEFSQGETRDDCAVTLLQSLESVKHLAESGLLSQEEVEKVAAAKAEHKMLQEARQEGHSEHDLKLPKSASVAPHASEAPPILFDDPRASIINFKPTESLRITCLTIGSRGDVQPYIALCKGFLAEGHKPKIATHKEFEPWVRKHGIEFAEVDGDPAELMRICVENGMFTYSFIKEASAKFRGWIDELLSSSWKACQDTDILIESPSAMAGIHIAEALSIPYFRAFTMPWTRTRAYPHAFAVPEHKMGGAYNYFTYVMFDNVFWKAIAGQVNRWRKKELNLPRTNLDKLQPNKVPFLYNFSPSVVAPPIDYSDWIRVTGYWFLNEAAGWEPPADLTEFIRQARKDGKKIVYVGFGSIVVSDPVALTKTVIDSVNKADVRCILSKGWADRLGSKSATEPEVPLPPSIHQIKSAPHDWLFQQIDAAAHHGGAGTTGASLRAGLPTIIKPFFGDQFFFGSRVEDLGVGICVKKLNVSVFSRALWEATHSERMIIKAQVLGESIRKENGVDNAIQAVYRDLEYARTLIKKRTMNADDGVEDSEESWTFIGDDADPELVRQIAQWEPMAQQGLARTGSPMDLGRKMLRGLSPGKVTAG